MSGDVQPRKRKDKRRKRDDDESSHGVHITKMGNEDVHLHVQHEHGTGGHWCAKIIFFALMAVLLGLVGLIIMENRGLEDLDTPLSESRFSNYFDGWVDEHRVEHEGHDDPHEPSGEALDDHDDHDDHDEYDDHDEHEEEEEPLSKELEEEDHEQEDEDEEPAASQDVEEEDEEEDEDENNAGENITAEDAEDEDEEDEDVEERTVEATVEATTEATAEYEADEDEEEDDEAGGDDNVVDSTEAPQSVADEEEEDEEAPPSAADEEEDDDEDQEVEESVEPPRTQSAAQSGPLDDNDDEDDEDNKDDDDDDEDDFESLDQQFENEDPAEKQPAKKLDSQEDKEQDQDDEEEPKEEGSSWLASQIKPKETPAAAPAAEKEDPFEQELRKANAEMIRENYAQALRSFNTLTQHYAHEPLAHLGRARVLELLAKKERSNQRVLEAIEAYKRYLAFGELVTSDQEFKAAGNSCIEHLRFMGYLQQAVNIHELLIERLPGDPKMRNQLSLTHLMANNLRQVEKVAAETLKLWPKDAVAQLHYGLALMHLHSDHQQAQPYLQYAVDSQAEGTQEPYFYISLGESLQRLFRQAEAREVYGKGVAKGFFASLYQRSLYNEPRLRAQPFWQPQETGYERQLEQLQLNWRSIRDEALALLGRSGSYFADEAEKLRDKGVWQQYELYAQGRQVRDNCRRAPITCNLLQQFPASAGCRRGQVKFSVMQAQTHVWPHCGPTNCRLRAHLTLVAPEPEKTSLRVAEQERTWREGELFIFDDSFEHEVWHNGSQARLVLILDMWHPDLAPAQRGSLSPI